MSRQVKALRAAVYPRDNTLQTNYNRDGTRFELPLSTGLRDTAHLDQCQRQRQCQLAAMPQLRTAWVTFDCYGTPFDWESGIRQFLRTHLGRDDLLEEWEGSSSA